jgi:hypothetical protein
VVIALPRVARARKHGNYLRGKGYEARMRTATAIALIALGCLAALLAWGPLQNLFSDYRDSPVSTYLLLGLPLLVIACAAFVGAWRLLSR